LAGAHLGMNEAVANMVALANVPLAHALHMASGVPATVLGLDHIYGSIAEGRPASLTCLAADFTPEAVYVHGRRSAA
ncbi:MAG: amidohydrolase family protein, partial [Pseudomonadota bacterium]|nr:amidohydrolase family protein [Pseudomonadota bacterium]